MSQYQISTHGPEEDASSEVMAEAEQAKSFLAQTCFLCGKETELDTGDIIYGDKWYHASCWNKIEKETPRA